MRRAKPGCPTPTRAAENVKVSGRTCIKLSTLWLPSSALLRKKQLARSKGVVTKDKGRGNYKLESVTGYCAHLRAWRRRASSSWPPLRRGVVFPSLRVIGRKQHMELFIHKQNMELFRKQLDAETNEARRNMLLRLLAQEGANGKRLEAKAKEITIRPRQPT